MHRAFAIASTTVNSLASLAVCAVLPQLYSSPGFNRLPGDLEVLEDWCHEGAFSQLSVPIKAALEQKLRFDAHVLDITDVEVIAAKLMEQGPVLVITFSAQQIMVSIQ